MSIAQVGAPLGPGPLATLRALRAERAEAIRWRRLLRARLDLVVASYAPAETLGVTGWDTLHRAQLTLPLPDELFDAVDVAQNGDDRVALMRRLRDLDRRLAAYCAEIDIALERVTEDLVMRLAADGTGLIADR
jgi:hypothetical protein